MNNTYKLEFLICPWCNKESGCRIDHLYKENLPFESDGFGGWVCNLCHKPIGVKILNSNEVKTWKSTRTPQQFYPALALLKLNNIYFIFKHEIYKENGENLSNNDIQKKAEYFYEEHSCPTNWISNCILISKNGDTDPHGYMEFIRVIEVNNDFDEDDQEKILSLFPELQIESN